MGSENLVSSKKEREDPNKGARHVRANDRLEPDFTSDLNWRSR